MERKVANRTAMRRKSCRALLALALLCVSSYGGAYAQQREQFVEQRRQQREQMQQERRQQRDQIQQEREQRRQQLRERARAADENQDRALNRDEAKRHFPRLGKRFDDIDGNRDGVITRDEVRSFRDARAKARVWAGEGDDPRD